MFSQQQQEPPQQQQEDAPRKVTAMAFDPKNPAALLLPAAPSNTTTANNNNGTMIAAMQLNTIFSHTGVGCNEHELAALAQIIDAAEAHSELSSQKQRSSWDVLKALSKAYRGALRDCLCRWEDNLVELEETGGMDADNEQEQQQQQQHLEVEHLEFLKLVYAVTHLSEIFLLPPPTETTSLDYYDSIYDIPGALTADTVRYLRHHHTVNALQQVDPDVLQELMDSMHPDQVDNGAPYWKLMNTLVQRGNLEQAWALLSRHSLCRRASDAHANAHNNNNNLGNDGSSSMVLEEYEELTLEKVQEGFSDLRRILLSAPLPGGRDDAEDIDLGDDGSKPETSSSSNNNYEVLLENVEPNGYMRWETSRTASQGPGGSDFPTSYTPTIASRVRQNWQQYVVDLPSIAQLKRRIPQLETMLNILLGNLKGIAFDTWAEALLAELIYANPLILPGNIQVRAEKLMKQYARTTTHGGEMDQVLLKIMQGNAGSVIEVLFAFGGGSGAALPATMVSFWCMFVCVIVW